MKRGPFGTALAWAAALAACLFAGRMIRDLTSCPIEAVIASNVPGPPSKKA